MGYLAASLAARAAARTLVDRLNLVPPVDIEGLLRLHATVERVEWPQINVDALLLGMAGKGSRLKVFIRATSNPLRERFTAAHELGHILLPWHVPGPTCQVAQDEGVPDLRSFTFEDEADIFASCVLVPDRWLSALVQDTDHDMSAVIRELNTASVSTEAAMQALRRYLLAGWVLVAYGDRLYSTPGTSLPKSPDGALTKGGRRIDVDGLDALKEAAADHGESCLNGHRVQWFRLTQSEALPAPGAGELRTAHQILLDAIIAAEFAPADATHVVASANGKVGGALRQASGRPAGETFDAMRNRLQDWEFSRLLDQPDFLLWLAQRARAIEAGQTKSKRRG